ncbi:MAG TPA: substrate-binding domain-containing protein [Kribbellaceae bacterium]|nr:substrate-binding domain-containing protein [Kribbellaceae bacterium]
MTLSGLAVLAIGGAFAVSSFGDGGGGADDLGAIECDEPITVTVAVAPELQPQVESAAKTLHSRDDGGACANFKVNSTTPAEVASAVSTGDTGRPDLWVPDSSLWMARADDGESAPAVAVPSLATSPLVLVGPDKALASTSSWLGVFTSAEPALLDPLGTATGTGTLLAIQSERAKTGMSDAQIGQVLVPLAQKYGSMPKPYTDVDGLFTKAALADSRTVVPATEQAFVAFQQKRPDSGLRAVVPGTGTLVFDYPMLVTAKENGQKVTEAGKRLAQELRSDASARALDAAGFRAATGEPLSGGRGVGNLALLPKPAADVAQKTLRQWATLALSSHSLAVIDASSSMLTKVGDKTWMDLTAEAAQAGLALFPNNSQLGLWAISTKLSGDNRDWAPLLPIRRLDAKVGSGDQRQEMLKALSGLKGQVGGPTGLYSAAIAAYRTVQDSYDPRSVNAVMIFTDGYSTDTGDLSLDDTLTTLQRLRDPARPVRLIAIGMGPNVDAPALEKIARTTGGSSYVARDPADIKKVFIDALQNR